MKPYSLLTTDQHDAIDRQYDHDETFMVAKMGAGKTVITLTAISELLQDGILDRVLVVAPLKVAKTVWAEEAKDWEHLQHLKIAKCLGTPKQRIAALESDAQIVVINFENLVWLLKTYKCQGIGEFDGLAIDELSKLRDVGAKTFKALRSCLRYFKWRVGLTGTPVSEDWTGLFGQMLIIDRGERLGTRKDMFLKKWFYATDYNEYNWELHDWAPEKLSELIADVVHVVPDYRHELIEPDYQVIEIDMPMSLRDSYEELKHDMVTHIDDNEIWADNAAVLVGKLGQLSCGFAYLGDEQAGEPRDVLQIDDFRVEACTKAVKASQSPVLVLYWFKADLERLQAAMPYAVVMDSQNADVIADQWNSGDIPVLLMQPRSAGHGLNLAKGGHEIIWYSPVWSRDLYEQTNARLWRRGQTERVRVREIVVNDSIDGIMRQRVEDKAEFEALWEEYLNGSMSHQDIKEK